MTQEAGCLIVFGVAAVITYAVTFAVRKVASRRSLLVMPDAERVHTVPTPTFGGVGMMVAFAAALGAASLLPVFSSSFQGSSEPLGVLLGAFVIFVVGFIDDLRDVSAPAKVAGQVLGAMVMYFLGVTMSHFKVPFAGFIVLSPSILPLVTALWVIGIANAVNLIDGLDGLAAGVVAIASASLCVYGLRLEELRILSSDNLGPIIAAAACGICIGFLPHNFHRAKIFMGDTGALFLGSLMAAATMLIGGQSYDYSGVTYFFFAPLLVPFVILGVPLLDVAFAIVRRTVGRSGVAARDLGHLHHRLMRLGHGHRRAVLLLWAWTAILSALVLYPTFSPRWNDAIPIGVAILGVGLYTVFRPGRKRVATAVAEVAAGPGEAEGLTAGSYSPAASPPGSSSPAPSGLPPSAPVAGAPGPQPSPGGRPGSEGAAHRVQGRRRFARHHRPMRG